MDKYFHVEENGFRLSKELFPTIEEFNKCRDALAAHLELTEISADAYLLSYDVLYRYRSDQEAHASIATYLFKLKIPTYSSLRFEVLHQGRINLKSFKIVLNVFNKKQEAVTLAKDRGSFYKDVAGDTYFLSPPNIGFFEAWAAFRSEAAEHSFQKDIKFRLSCYGRLVNAYDKLEIDGTSLLDTFKVKVIDSLDYNLVGNDDGTLDVVPAFQNDMRKLNAGINRVAEGATEFRDNVILADRRTHKRYSLVFSEQAVPAWKKFLELKRLSPEARSQQLKSGEFIGAFPPREVIGNVFSERVVGFVLETPQQVARDTQSNESWSEGFDDLSNLIHSTSHSSYSVSLSPAPEIYVEIKSKILELKTLNRDALAKAKSETGAVHTVPEIDEHNVFVESLKDSFSIEELETLVDRIEKSNRLELEDTEIDNAKKTLNAAQDRSEHMVVWDRGDGSPALLIPTRSLELSLKEASIPDSKNKTVGIKIAELIESDGSFDEKIDPNWFLESLDAEGFSKSSVFRDHVRLKPYQVHGYAWLRGIATDQRIEKICKRRGALLADDMGLGKTIQVIRLIAAFKNEFTNSSKPILIVGPVSLLKTSWEKDGLKKFFNEEFLNKNPILHVKDIPNLLPRELLVKEILAIENLMEQDPLLDFKSLKLGEEINQCIEAFKKRIGSSIVLCSYETMRSRIFELAAIDFSLVVLDEAQKIKNLSAGQSRAAKALKADMKVAMTGTPIENSISDLWNICDFVVPDYLGPIKSFREKYQKRIAHAPAGSEERKSLASELESELSPIWLRRTKKEILKNGEIPPIIHFDSCSLENGTVANKHLVRMSDPQYAVFQTQVGYFNESKGGQKLSAIRNMLEACYAPWWARDIKADYSNIDRLFELSPKLKITFDILSEIASKCEKVLIFANIIELQRELAGLIHQWHYYVSGKSVDCEFFNGEFTLEQRSQILNRFQTAQGFKALVISPRSGGAGLNLVEANHVIHYTREWNPAVERQATDRAHRIGQNKTVHVYYPTSSLAHIGKTSAEEHLANILRAKRDVMDDFTISDAGVDKGENQFESYQFATDKTRLTPEGIRTLGPYKFEMLVALYFKAQGYKVEVVGGSSDRGCDIVCFGKERNLLVQVKFTEIGQPQGTAAINQVRGSKSVYEQNRKATFQLAAVTNAMFSPNAHGFSFNGDIVELIEGSKIIDFVLSTQIMMSDLRSA